MTIKKTYDNGYSVKQYYSKDWKCNINDKDIPMTLVVEVMNMYDATGEGEYKDYPCVFSIGMLNKNISKNKMREIDSDVFDDNGCIGVEDVIGYCGMNCYLEQLFLDTDLINKCIQNDLRIGEASTHTYKCRFTNKDKTFLKFKTEDDAFKFAERLVNEYGHTFMTLIGFYLDRPINLMGETGWKQTEELSK